MGEGHNQTESIQLTFGGGTSKGNKVFAHYIPTENNKGPSPTTMGGDVQFSMPSPGNHERFSIESNMIASSIGNRPSLKKGLESDTERKEMSEMKVSLRTHRRVRESPYKQTSPSPKAHRPLPKTGSPFNTGSSIKQCKINHRNSNSLNKKMLASFAKGRGTAESSQRHKKKEAAKQSFN
mmetsp:Transcript_26411/g.40318  ORF Transcript_26411/g.40318 Transcript_26411/m.40318 type:complete len:180 (+) Transcript_26411:269-808(+)